MSKLTSSPAATGGAGTFFEQHVNAYWLALLLVRAIPPIFIDSIITEVLFQTEHLGWKTDDFLIVTEDDKALCHRMVGQVKRTFTVSAADDECRKAILDFWNDFSGTQFSRDRDCFLLVTLRGTNTLLEHFVGLLDCARAAPDSIEFHRRLNVAGFISKKSNSYLGELAKIIETAGSGPSADDLWQFLKSLNVLSLDLNTSTSQTEALVRTILAHTAEGGSATATAGSTWNALLAECSRGAPQSRRYQRGDLPTQLLELHSAVETSGSKALQALREHSDTILRRVSTTLGGRFHLSRPHLARQVVNHLGAAQVVIINGAAGSGKSGLAKEVYDLLAPDHFAFWFGAVEFSHANLNVALAQNQIPMTSAKLSAVLAAQGRKVLFIESTERLLESGIRDAFGDLLLLVKSDPSWRVVLTCRDYSTDLVRAGILGATGTSNVILNVPVLDDLELEQIQGELPSLKRPLENAKLRRLLRNLYFLDKALLVDWAKERTLPQSERDLRLLFWQQIVRVEHVASDGMPRRREQAFMQLAVQRAMQLTSFVPCDKVDPLAVEKLRSDNLLESSKQSNLLVAPSHDVLEDWAIVQWVDEQHALNLNSAANFSNAIGTYPAIRRSYRKWVSEFMNEDANVSDEFFSAVIGEENLATQFRDDTLISILRSPTSPALLKRWQTQLFAEGKSLFRRIIHLLRVAGVGKPAWTPADSVNASFLNIPKGPAWAHVLKVTQENLAIFNATDAVLLLGLIEDWARGVTLNRPYPAGNESAADIAFWLLPHFDEHDLADERKRALHVILKVPKGNPARLVELLSGPEDEDTDTYINDDLLELIFEETGGVAAARDFPLAVIEAAYGYFLCSEEEFANDRLYGGTMDLEPLFGISPHRSHGFTPPSAYRGPFLPLLRHHPSEALTFYYKIFNQSAEWYARPRVRVEFVEPPFEIELKFPDHPVGRQWANSRLWNMYRGSSVGPYCIQSLLMALERWLLEVAEAQPDSVDSLLLGILRQSESVALTAVVASVATAFPHLASETLLILMRSREIVSMDRLRLAHESQVPSSMLALMSTVRPEDRFYEAERSEADKLPHHRRCLENAVASLHFTRSAPRVRVILDELRTELPPLEVQTEDDRVWRLTLHRMDLRSYTVAEPAENVPSDSGSANTTRIELNLKLDEPDIKEMVEKAAESGRTTNSRLMLQMWAHKVFEGEIDSSTDPMSWRDQLDAARADDNASDEMADAFARYGPGIVAAVCVRDHWHEMNQGDREWCTARVCAEVLSHIQEWNHMARVQRHSMSPDRPCAMVLPILMSKQFDSDMAADLKGVFATALMHPIDEVRAYAAAGVGRYLWSIDRELAIRCINTIATGAMLVQKKIDSEKNVHWQHRTPIDRIEFEIAKVVYKQFINDEDIPPDAYEKLDINRNVGAEANARILPICANAPLEAISVLAFGRLSAELVKWWDADDDRSSDRRERNHQAESAARNALEHFLLKTSASAASEIAQPLVNAIEKHSDEIRWVIQGLIAAEDLVGNPAQFWLIWSLFAKRLRTAAWLSRIDREHATGRVLLSTMFLTAFWKDGVSQWSSLEGYSENVHQLFDDLIASPVILNDYSSFLYRIGSQSLPDAFIRIANKITSAKKTLVPTANTVFCLESLLLRHVYSKPRELKQNLKLRDAILFLLDVLVDNGSSSAFQMRDDFVTPLSES